MTLYTTKLVGAKQITPHVNNQSSLWDANTNTKWDVYANINRMRIFKTA